MKERPRKKDRKQPKPRIKQFEEVRPRTETQRLAIEAIRSKTITILTGTAGTGKTLIAISEALRAIEIGKASKLVLVRPMVTVGNPIGFLPGEVLEKIAPYAEPLLIYIDELMHSKDYSKKMIEAGVFEIVPLALIRGRTFKDSIVLLDEAQNTTTTEMHAFLTRLGEYSKMIIVGDIDQTDLPDHIMSGLEELLNIARGPNVSTVVFSRDDIQRSEMLKEIYDWYDDDSR